MMDKQHYNQEAEEAILGAIFQDNSLLRGTIINESHLFFEQHKILFTIMKELHEKELPIEMIQVAEILKRKGQFDAIGGFRFVAHISECVVTTANFKHHEKIVLDHWKIRESIRKSGELQHVLANQKDFEKAQIILQDIEQIQTHSRKEKFSLRDAMVEVYEGMQKETGELTGVDTGYVALNVMTSGLQRQNLMIIAARPSLGKTAFALNVAKNAAKDPVDKSTGEIKKGAIVSIHSLETPTNDLLKRMICAEGNIDASKMRNPMQFFNGEDWSKSAMSMGVINQLDIHIDDEATQSVSDIYRTANELRKANPDRDLVVIIDYLQLIKGSGRHGNNRQQEVAEISRSLKLMARKLDCTVIALSQLSRAVESRQDKRPVMSDLRETGAIEQDADLIAFLYRDDYYNKDSEVKNIIEVIIGKQRNGPIGTVELAFIKEFNKFVNLERPAT
ncbi:replicative DNA helicase [Bacillus thuringiensis]